MLQKLKMIIVKRILFKYFEKLQIDYKSNFAINCFVKTQRFIIALKLKNYYFKSPNYSNWHLHYPLVQ